MCNSVVVMMIAMYMTYASEVIPYMVNKSIIIYIISYTQGSSINDVMLFWGIFYPPPLLSP